MLVITGDSITEIAEIQAMLAGVEGAIMALFGNREVYPEAVRLAVPAVGALTVQLRRITVDDSIRVDMQYQGVRLDGIALIEQRTLGILGDGRNAATALAVYSAVALHKIPYTQLTNAATTEGPNADLTVNGPIEIVNTAGDGKTDLAMMIPWSLRCALRIGTLSNAIRTESP